MTKHLDNLVKRQLKRQRRLRNESGSKGAKQSKLLNNNNNNNDDSESLETTENNSLENQDDIDQCPKLIDTSKTLVIKSLLSNHTFNDLKNVLSENTLKAIEDLEFTHMTEIQSKTIPHLLEGK